MLRRRSFWMLVLAVGLTGAAQGARTVHLDIGGGLQAQALYFAARPDRPAVLLVHDFLATGRGALTHILAQRLAEEGVGLLSPTLTLGIPHRGEPLACAALHLHDFEEGVREISLWVDWLLGQRRTRIVIVGVGVGAWQSAAVGQRTLSKAVRSLVLIDPRRPDTDAAQLEALQAATRAGDTGLQQHGLWQCGRFTAPAPQLYSYARWTPPVSLRSLRESRVGVRVLTGGGAAMDEGWRKQLGEAGAAVKYVPDAEDFSDPRHIGALLEMIVAALQIDG